MITKNQKVVEELKKKQLEESTKKNENLKDNSFQEMTKKKKSLSKKKGKKIKKKAEAPKQKKSGIAAFFSGKWKGIASLFSSKKKTKKDTKTEKKKQNIITDIAAEKEKQDIITDVAAEKEKQDLITDVATENQELAESKTEIIKESVSENEKIIRISTEKVREKLDEEEQKRLEEEVRSMDSQLESRRKTGDWEDKNVIYEDEKPFMEDFKQVSESFSNNEGDALLYYAGEGFWAINNVLRNKDAEESEEDRKKAQDVKTVTQRSVITKDVTVMRHIDPSKMHLVLGTSEPYQTTEDVYQELKKEAGVTKYVFREKGLCSTTMNPFGVEGFNTLPVEMRILVPKGSRGIYIEHSKYSFMGERELVLAPDTDFQLIGVKKEECKRDFLINDSNGKKNMGRTKLVMYMKVLPKNEEGGAQNAA